MNPSVYKMKPNVRYKSGAAKRAADEKKSPANREKKRKASGENHEIPDKKSIFRLKICIFRLKICIFRFAICIFRLKIENPSARLELFPTVSGAFPAPFSFFSHINPTINPLPSQNYFRLHYQSTYRTKWHIHGFFLRIAGIEAFFAHDFKVNRQMTRSILFLGLGLLGLSVTACYDKYNTYGSDLVESSFRSVSVDSCTVTMVSTRIDSVETSGKKVALAGQYKHPYWGTISARSYIAYKRPSYSTDIDETVLLDSLVLSLRYDSKFIGDTTRVQTLSVYQLTDKITLNDNGYLYNTSHFAYDSERLGSYSFFPQPGSGERIDIRLSDILGQELLERFHRRDRVTTNDDQFADYFRGVTVTPDPLASESLLSFAVDDSSCALVLYYHLFDEQSTKKELWFVPNTETQFNHLEQDVNGTALADIAIGKDGIPSEEIGNRSVLFGGLGWYTTLDFPYLNNLMEHGTQVEIESATLRLYPEPGSYSDFNALPDSVYLYYLDGTTANQDVVANYLGSKVTRGTLSNDDTHAKGTYYTFDVTDFLYEELGAFGMYKHKLQLAFNSDDYTGSCRNLTFCDRQGTYPIVLQITYTIYESY